MIAWFTRNHVAANLLMVSLLLAGIISIKARIPLEIFPSIELDAVNISVTLRGATPEDVEQGVTIRIEEAVQDLEGVDRIISSSSEGSARVSLLIESGYEARDILADVKSRVDGINTLPADAENPIVSLAQRIRDVITVVVAGKYSETETREFAEKIRDDLLRLPGITQLELDGVRDYEISVEVPHDTLREYQLSLADISNAIATSSIDISAGNLRTSGGDVLLRSKGQAYRKDDFENIVIKTSTDGSILHLGDIAIINDGFEESPVKTRFNGNEAAFISVYRTGQQSAIEVANTVKTYIDEQQDILPVGYQLNYWDDDSEIVKNRLNTLISNAIQGGILVMALLTLFLRPSIAFWVFLGIPISFMGAFIFMPFAGATINIMSLFGFIVVLGIVVDDAIVTGENVYTNMKTASSAEEAAIKGTAEVATPVTFGILTTVVAFLPLAFIEGPRGVLFAQLPMVVIPVLLFSLVESKFVLPAHLKTVKLRKPEQQQNRFELWQQRFANGFEGAIIKYYQPVLSLALRHKTATISLFLGLFLVVLSIITSGWTKFTPFPRIPSETLRISLQMPTGTPYAVTDKFITRISNAAYRLQQEHIDELTNRSVITNILATTGGRGGQENVGSVRFEITPPEKRSYAISSQQLLRQWRREIGIIPGAESMTFRAELGRSSSPIDVQLSGTDLNQLNDIAELIKQHLTTYPTVFEIADSLPTGKQELQIELTEQGKALGLTRGNVSTQVRNAYFGAQVQRIQRGRDDVRVSVKLPINERQSIADLQQLIINTPSGQTAPLSHVATLNPDSGPSTITRVDRYRTINVTADIEKDNTNMTTLQASLREFLDELLVQYPAVNYTLEGEAKEQSDSFGSLKLGLVFVMFIIYCLLAIPFKSYWQPLVVMSIIPFGVLGAVIGHWIMAMNLSLMSLLGMLALVGVVVNDSLVLVDFINKKHAQGKDLLHCILTAGAARVRPVMLTSLTTFFGLMPLLFEKSTQAQFLIPMAVSLGFGILFATLITLILVPVNYLVLHRLVNMFRR